MARILFLDDSEIRCAKMRAALAHLSKRINAEIEMVWVTDPESAIRELETNTWTAVSLDGDLVELSDLISAIKLQQSNPEKFRRLWEMTGEQVTKWIKKKTHPQSDERNAELAAKLSNTVFVIHTMNPVKGTSMAADLLSCGIKTIVAPYGSQMFLKAYSFTRTNSDFQPAED